MESLKKIKTKSLRAQVYSQLRARLLDGYWQPGEKIPSESQLCNIFGVSRVTVRAAIQQLEILGLVEVKHGGGTYVRKISSSDEFGRSHPFIQVRKIKDIITTLEYRKIIEKGTVGLAALRATSEDIEYLENTVKSLKKFSGNHEKCAEVDNLFHHRIAVSTKNPIVIKVYNLLNDMLSTAMVDIVKILGNEKALNFHTQIIEALRKADKELCEKIMEQHIDDTIQGIIANQHKIATE